MFGLGAFLTGGPESKTYEGGTGDRMSYGQMTCIVSLRCPDYFSDFFRHPIYLLEICSIFSEDVGNLEAFKKS